MTAKTRNPDRKNGKAWGKNHAPAVKVLSPEAQLRKAEKDLRRQRTAQFSGYDRKPNITMPRITWRWAEEIMVARWPSTRRLRMLDAALAQQRGKPRSAVALAVEPNPEAKVSR